MCLHRLLDEPDARYKDPIPARVLPALLSSSPPLLADALPPFSESRVDFHGQRSNHRSPFAGREKPKTSGQDIQRARMAIKITLIADGTGGGGGGNTLKPRLLPLISY